MAGPAAPDGLRANTGTCPREAAGRRIRAVLKNGYDTALREPGGWAADGRAAADWSLRAGGWSIAFWGLIA